MSNRTDFLSLAAELRAMFGLSEEATTRIATELHNAYVAGQEGSEETVEESAQLLAVQLPLVRDADSHDDKLRAAFLSRVCSLGEMTFRRDVWPIRELGVSVTDGGAYQVRVRSLVLDRDTRKVGETESIHDTDSAHYVRRPERIVLAEAVRWALIEHFEHEVSENIYYKGERILDPHRGDRG